MIVSNRPLKIALVSIWAIFGAAVLLLDWQEASTLYWAINVVGLAGLAAAIAWFVRGGQWIKLCIATSAVFLLLYLVQWGIQVRELYYASPESGITTAMYRLAAAWRTLFSWRQDKFGMGWALLAIYWDVVVVVLQISVLFLLLKRTSTKDALK